MFGGESGEGKDSSYLIICHLCHAFSFSLMHPHSYTLTALREEAGQGGGGERGGEEKEEELHEKLS